MLLRAYVIRLADGLVASRDQLSVVTDIFRRFLIHFAGAKVGLLNQMDCHGDITVIKIKSWACTYVTVFVGHSVQLTLEIWLVTDFVVPLHRQSRRPASRHAYTTDGRTGGATVQRTNGREVVWTYGLPDRRTDISRV